MTSNPLRDEFYTTAKTAKRFLEDSYLWKCLAGKNVACPCDSPESEIFKLLCQHFDDWHLKSLQATAYKQGGNGLHSVFLPGEGISTCLLEGDGDYNSSECRQIWESADIVITNPPFSDHFFIPRLVDAGKKFAII